MPLRRLFLVMAYVVVACGMAVLRLSVSNSEPPFTEGALTWRDRLEIQDLVREQTFDSIIDIKCTGHWQIEVWAGVTCGPLCGGGRCFEFKKHQGRWQPINTNAIKVFVY